MIVTKKNFRIFIAAQFAAIIVGGIDFYFDNTLPIELSKWIEKSYEQESTLLDLISPMIGVIGLVSMIGLLFLKYGQEIYF